MTRPRRAALAALTIVIATLPAACSGGPTLPFVPSDTPEPTPVPPRDVVVTVTERGTGAPVGGSYVEAGESAALTAADGTAIVTASTGSAVEVSAPGYDPGTASVGDSDTLAVDLRRNVLSGTVTDADGAPLADVRVFVDGADTLVTTDASGGYELPGVPEDAVVIFKRAGHRLGEVEVGDQMTVDIALERFDARALYAPAEVFESQDRLDELLALIDRTEVNALVIDVKETEGVLYYATDLEAAVEVGAVREDPVLDLDELLPMLRERGIYTIARMVVMKDNTLVAARPELAVINSSTGQPWRDNLGGAWLDPAAPGVAEYAAAIAGDLADRGFDEVQLDYIRFYSDGPLALADPGLPNTQPMRLAAMRRVLRVISDALATERAFLAADVFPISFILADDQGIGQRPDVVMPYVDVICPMTYPSHFGPGVFGLPVPNDHPYEVVDGTLAIMNEQAAEWPVAIRPWIQDFGYGPFPRYAPAQVREQMEAAEARAAHGWMIWNPFASFTESALEPPRPGEDAGPVTAGAEIPPQPLTP